MFFTKQPPPLAVSNIQIHLAGIDDPDETVTSSTVFSEVLVGTPKYCVELDIELIVYPPLTAVSFHLIEFPYVETYPLVSDKADE